MHEHFALICLDIAEIYNFHQWCQEEEEELSVYMWTQKLTTICNFAVILDQAVWHRSVVSHLTHW